MGIKNRKMEKKRKGRKERKEALCKKER